MSFISVEFFTLFSVILLLLLIWRNKLWAKTVLLFASCVFYAYWDWRFLGLLGFVTLVDYFISTRIYRSDASNVRKHWLFISIAVNLTILGYFKYFNFFVGILDLLLHPFKLSVSTREIILPVGISFYVFESISYVVDVYHGITLPASSLLDYAVFITFFPRLVAGPIMRASHFLPQLYRGIQFSRDNFFLSAQLFAQGLIKKIVVADSIALFVDAVYKTPGLFSVFTIYLAIFAYSIQIYFDFSGYSDMACGIARGFGFELPVNFNFPYFAESFSDFWKRWHISLSTWLRDYLYIPLGGSRNGKTRTYVNLLLTMLLGGLWHGASWNFVFWGGLHGIFLAIERFIKEKFHNQTRVSTKAVWWKPLIMFFVVSIIWVFFRSPSLETTYIVFKKLLFVDVSGTLWVYVPAVVFSFVVVLGGIFINRINIAGFELSFTKFVVSNPFAASFLLFEYLFVLLFFAQNSSPFIYFQF